MWLSKVRVAKNQPSKGQDKVMVKKVHYAFLDKIILLIKYQLGIGNL